MNRCAPALTALSNAATMMTRINGRTHRHSVARRPDLTPGADGRSGVCPRSAGGAADYPRRYPDADCRGPLPRHREQQGRPDQQPAAGPRGLQGPRQVRSRRQLQRQHRRRDRRVDHQRLEQHRHRYRRYRRQHVRQASVLRGRPGEGARAAVRQPRAAPWRGDRSHDARRRRLCDRQAGVDLASEGMVLRRDRAHPGLSRRSDDAERFLALSKSRELQLLPGPGAERRCRAASRRLRTTCGPTACRPCTAP